MASLLWNLTTLHLLVVILVLFIDQSNANSFDVKSWCENHTRRIPDLCASSLQSDPRTSNLDNVQLLSNISMDILLAIATAIRLEINNTRNNNNLSKIDPEGWLYACVLDYDAAIEETQTAIQEFQLGTIPSDQLNVIEGRLYRAYAWINICRAGLTNHGVPVPELINKIELSRQLSIVATEIFQVTHSTA